MSGAEWVSGNLQDEPNVSHAVGESDLAPAQAASSVVGGLTKGTPAPASTVVLERAACSASP